LTYELEQVIASLETSSKNIEYLTVKKKRFGVAPVIIFAIPGDIKLDKINALVFGHQAKFHGIFFNQK